MKKLCSADHPVWAMAFRPFYLLCALYGAFSVLLWGFGFTGTRAISGYLWHAHEMVWGYAGGIVVAFLLTAVATWTQQPPIRGKFLIWLVGLWLAARLTAFLPWGIPTGLLGTAFFWLGAYGMWQSVWASRNTRNYIAVAAIVLLGFSHLAFHYYAWVGETDTLRTGLSAGIVMVAGFIGLIGNRIIPFFTARRLNTPQVQTPMNAMLAALVLPMAATALMMTHTAVALAAWLILGAGCLGCVQSYRWFNRGILGEPMLWTLHLGYAASSLGMVVLAVSFAAPSLQSLGVHLLAVGGIGLLTVSMMVRTALGHTARPLYPAPAGMGTAFWLMVAATAVRALAAVMAFVNATAYTHSIRLSAVLFAASLLLYFWRYRPWLTQPRLDGKAG